MEDETEMESVHELAAERKKAESKLRRAMARARATAALNVGESNAEAPDLQTPCPTPESTRPTEPRSARPPTAPVAPGSLEGF